MIVIIEPCNFLRARPHTHIHTYTLTHSHTHTHTHTHSLTHTLTPTHTPTHPHTHTHTHTQFPVYCRCSSRAAQHPRSFVWSSLQCAFACWIRPHTARTRRQHPYLRSMRSPRVGGCRRTSCSACHFTVGAACTRTCCATVCPRPRQLLGLALTALPPLSWAWRSRNATDPDSLSGTLRELCREPCTLHPDFDGCMCEAVRGRMSKSQSLCKSLF
jgi:hypothetical protein